MIGHGACTSFVPLLCRRSFDGRPTRFEPAMETVHRRSPHENAKRSKGIGSGRICPKLCSFYLNANRCNCTPAVVLARCSSKAEGETGTPKPEVVTTEPREEVVLLLSAIRIIGILTAIVFAALFFIA
mmetsp:Transcript_1606/g.9907  ORF Transcript_1606/g.9907 Transcript_1606/m.9907 type:complete len:128 (+) Transcript_1606:2318-2701(+)